MAVAATYIVPAGTFDREETDGVTTVISGTYENVEADPVHFKRPAGVRKKL